MVVQDLNCRVCSNKTEYLGFKQGKWRQDVDYHFYHCDYCGFAFVGNPSVDYKNIYSIDYYKGFGADPYVDYIYEFEFPEKTIRKYEWSGIVSIIEQMIPISSELKWLDFGCGSGGLLRYLSNQTSCQIFGYEQSIMAERLYSSNIPLIFEQDFTKLYDTFDVITAIEVLEHVEEPLRLIKTIFKLLKPGGIFLYTTGNKSKFNENIIKWSYAVPEIHISFYEPRTMKFIFENIGFRTKHVRYFSGFTSLIRFKILKNLKVKNINFFEKIIYWPLVSFVVDLKYGITEFPVAIKD